MEAVVQTPAWLQERREHAAKRFGQVGFPSVRHEDWRFSNVSPIADAKLPLASGPFSRAPEIVRSVSVPGAVRLVIVNGEFVPALSDLSALPKGLRIAGLRDGARDGTDGLEQHLAGVQRRNASVRGTQHIGRSAAASTSRPASPSFP